MRCNLAGLIFVINKRTVNILGDPKLRYVLLLHNACLYLISRSYFAMLFLNIDHR